MDKVRVEGIWKEKVTEIIGQVVVSKSIKFTVDHFPNRGRRGRNHVEILLEQSQRQKTTGSLYPIDEFYKDKNIMILTIYNYFKLLLRLD
jgi:hypothetical protein